MKEYADFQQQLNQTIGKKDLEAFADELLEAFKDQQTRNNILVNHIAGNTGYPMNFYEVTTETQTIIEGQAIRKIFTYTDTSNGKVVARVFEQNWFAGYGTPVEGRGYIGLMDD